MKLKMNASALLLESIRVDFSLLQTLTIYKTCFFKIVSEVSKVRTKARELLLFTSHRSCLLRLREGGDECRINVRTLETFDTILKRRFIAHTYQFFGCLQCSLPGKNFPGIPGSKISRQYRKKRETQYLLNKQPSFYIKIVKSN